MGRSALGALGITAILAASGVGASSAYATASTATAWGYNNDGQLGDGTQGYPYSSDVPVAVSGLSEVATISSAGPSLLYPGSPGNHTLALLKDGTVMSWGRDNEGELGDGHEGYEYRSDVPVPVSGLTEVIAVSAGDEFSLALLRDGTVMSWGNNDYGKLGDGHEGYEYRSDVPVPVSGLSEVVAIAAGGEHSLALLKNGTVMSWGRNNEGELGDGHEGYEYRSDVPVPVSGLSEVVAIAAGAEHSLALLKGGTVMAWGANVEGQLGDGQEGFYTKSDVPVAVSGLSEVTAVAAGGAFSLALIGNTGSVKRWGLVSGYGSQRDVPVTAYDSGATAIAAGTEHALALLSNGTIISWGQDGSGQLGDGTTERASSHVLMCGTGAAATGIAAGGDQSFAYGPPRTLCPGIRAVQPNTGAGAGGTAVTITGSELAGATAVTFGSKPAASFTVNSNTSITAISPPNPANYYDVRVTTPAGTTEKAGLDRFTYEVGPKVIQVSPGGGPGAGGTSVSIFGSNLDAVTGVSFGSTAAASFKVNSNTSITAVAPSGSGIVDVRATNSEGTSPAGSGDRFSYEVGPLVTVVVPRTGPPAGGTTVTITGRNLAGVTAVQFGSTAAESFNVNSNTSITAVAPPGSGTVDLRLTNSEATSAASAADRFTYTEGPPEFGRCVKVAKGTGVYATSNCTSAGGEEKFEWLAGPGPNSQLTTTLKKPLILEGAVGHSRFTCNNESGSGEVSGPRTIANLTLHFTGCEGGGWRCNTKGFGEGEVLLQGYVAVPGVVKTGATPVKDQVGLTLEGKSAIECGPLLLEIRGSAIGKVSPTNSMATVRTWTFTLAAKTRQNPEAFEGGGPQFWELSGCCSVEQAAFSLQLSVTSAEKLEIDTVV